MPWPFRRGEDDTLTGDQMAFPSPFGQTPAAARMPWRLPDEPALSGIAADAASVGGLTVRAASLVGPGHRCAEPAGPRQDAYKLGRDAAGRYLIVAVADGMSDSSRAHLGASVAVSALVGRLRADLNRDAPLRAPEIFLEAARQMSGAAEQFGVTENDVRAAALAAVIPVLPDGSGRREIWLASVADVCGWLREPRGWRRLAGAEKTGFDAGTLTEFLPFHPDRATATTVVLEPGAVVALTSDGVGDALGQAEATSAWFAERWTRPPHISLFLQEVGFEANGHLDDRTAVVVWCGP
ncbi:protein phosphatase 2C domain-containing protein [Actinocorallia longicatena]|uniref:PPM-type phosphatase domain-containing protein n=1 Tax=Actinocorallia longicatena TaxID=111803 RepID=A0ABP6QL68_9ACTN